jgi:hypothetical protein
VAYRLTILSAASQRTTLVPGTMLAAEISDALFLRPAQSYQVLLEACNSVGCATSPLVGVTTLEAGTFGEHGGNGWV